MSELEAAGLLGEDQFEMKGVVGEKLAADGLFLVADGFAVGDDDGYRAEGLWAGEVGEGGHFLLEKGRG